MPWTDVISGERGEELDFPEGFSCEIGSLRLARAEAARLQVYLAGDEVKRLVLELRFAPEELRRIADAGLWGVTRQFVQELPPGVRPNVVLEALPDFLARDQETLRSIGSKTESLSVGEAPGRFPEFLRLGNYRLVRVEQ